MAGTIGTFGSDLGWLNRLQSFAHERRMQREQLAQQRALADQQMAMDIQRMQLARDEMGQRGDQFKAGLDLDERRMIEQRNQFGEELGFRRSESAADRAFRGTLAGNEDTLRRDLARDERSMRGSQFDREMGLREGQFEYAKGRDAIGDSRYQAQLERDLPWENEVRNRTRSEWTSSDKQRGLDNQLALYKAQLEAQVLAGTIAEKDAADQMRAFELQLDRERQIINYREQIAKENKEFLRPMQDEVTTARALEKMRRAPIFAKQGAGEPLTPDEEALLASPLPKFDANQYKDDLHPLPTVEFRPFSTDTSIARRRSEERNALRYSLGMYNDFLNSKLNVR